MIHFNDQGYPVPGIWPFFYNYSCGYYNVIIIGDGYLGVQKVIASIRCKLFCQQRVACGIQQDNMHA